MSDKDFLSISNLSVTLGHGMEATQVLHGVSLSVGRGRTLGIVGESGSGKSTIAKTLVGLHRADSGSMVFDGLDMVTASRRQRKAAQRRIQLIPQDPYSSLDPHRTIGSTLAEAIDPVRARVKVHRDEIVASLAAVSLGADVIERYPFEFSGGQRQRIAIARALATNPEIIVADEITSALDVSTQAEILKLMASLKNELGLTVLFISHNLAVVHEICDEVLVLLHGDVVESGPTARVFQNPISDYTRRLIDSVPGSRGFAITSE